MKNPLIIIAIISVVLLGGAVWYSYSVSNSANEGVEVVDQIKGNPDANVVVVEYADFQCPACAQFQPIVKEIMDEYGEQVRFEFRHFPLVAIHPYAEPAARAAEAAGQQGKFFEYHDLLFEQQSEWSGSINPAAHFARYAEELELDVATFNAHQKSSVLREVIREDMQSGREREVTGTPTFFLNGERVELQTIGDLRAQIESALGITDETATTSTSTETVSPTGAGGSANFRFGI